MSLIDDIKENRCILFTGPYMSAYEQNGPGSEWISHTELYCTELQARLQQQSIPFDANARNNPYYLAGKWLRTGDKAAEDNATIVQNAYRRTPNLYKELAVIPFYTTVNFGFDHLMEEALRAENYEFAADFYNYRGEDVVHKEVNEDLPLVYNLFGSIDVEDSRIVTEQDQLEFLKRIGKTGALPNYLLRRMQNPNDRTKPKKSYVFLGFDFEDWPFRFLLDILGVPYSEKAVTPQAAATQIAVVTNEFLKDRFGIKFSTQSPQDFISQLVGDYRRSATKHQYGYLSFVEKDEKIKDTFVEFLQTELLARRIAFWDKGMVKTGQIADEIISEKLEQATVYIPFISYKALINEKFNAEMNAMKEKPNVLFFPVICDVCSWKIQFPWLEKKVKEGGLVLPGKNEADVLTSSEKKASNETFINMIRAINSKVR